MSFSKSVHVTDHALSKTKNGIGRTHLWFEEIRELVVKKQYITLGVNDGADFLLVWDHVLKKPVVLLVRYHTDRIVVVSIWEIQYRGIPNGEPSEEQIVQAQHLAMAPEAPWERFGGLHFLNQPNHRLFER